MDDELDLPQSVESSDEETFQLGLVSLVRRGVEDLARAVDITNKQSPQSRNSYMKVKCLPHIR